MKQRATKEWPVITTDRINRPNVDIINKYAVDGAIITGQIAVKCIYHNVLWPDIVRKRDMICLMVVHATGMSHPPTGQIIAARPGMRILTVPARFCKNP